MKKTFISLIFACFVSAALFSQDLLWNLSTDTLQLYYLKDVVTDGDGNVYAGADGIGSAYILKYDKNGQVVFAAGSDNDVRFNCMYRKDNGRMVMAGEIDNGGQDDAWLLAIDEYGNEMFSQTYDQDLRSDEFNDVVCDDDGYIYLCGNSYNSSIEQCGVLAKYAPNGTPVWIRLYNIANRHIHFDILTLHSNGNISVTGINSPTSPGNIELLNVTYDNNGMQLSEYAGLVGGKQEVLAAFALTDEEDNQYIGGLTRDSGIEESFLIKLTDNSLTWFQGNPSAGESKFLDGCMDAAGNIVCCGELSGVSKDAYCACYSQNGGLLSEFIYDSEYGLEDIFMNLSSDGDYIYACGASEGLGTSIDMIAMKLNSDLVQMWDIRYNSFSSESEYGAKIKCDYEGNIIIGGIQMGSLGYAMDIWKYSNPLGIAESGNKKPGRFSIYPNPAKDLLNFDIEGLGTNTEYRLLSAGGETMLSGRLKGQSIAIGKLSSGLYYILLNDRGKQYYAKFVKK